MKNKFNLNEFLNKKPTQMVLSVLGAIIFWAVVAYSISNDFTRPMHDIPISLGATSYKNYGLELVGGLDTTVTVTVEGERGVVGALTQEDIVVTPITSSVSEPGSYELTLSVQKANPLADFNIVSVSPRTVNLSFEVLDAKTFSLETEIDGLYAETGYIIGTVATDPGEVIVTGPEDELAKVHRVVAKTYVAGPLVASTNATAKVMLLDSKGEEIESSKIIVNAEEVEVSIPLLKKGVLPLEVGFINLPDGFSEDSLQYTMSVNEINIAAAASVIDNLTAKTVGYIDLAAFEIGKSYTFDIPLSPGTVNIDNIGTVTVTFKTSSLERRQYKVDELRLENVPEGFNCELITESVTVSVIGESSQLDELQSGSIVAIVDCSKRIIEGGEYDMELRFSIPAHESVFVVGSYTALMSATAN